MKSPRTKKQRKKQIKKRSIRPSTSELRRFKNRHDSYKKTITSVSENYIPDTTTDKQVQRM